MSSFELSPPFNCFLSNQYSTPSALLCIGIKFWFNGQLLVCQKSCQEAVFVYICRLASITLLFKCSVISTHALDYKIDCVFYIWFIVWILFIAYVCHYISKLGVINWPVTSNIRNITYTNYMIKSFIISYTHSVFESLSLVSVSVSLFLLCVNNGLYDAAIVGGSTALLESLL